MPSTSIFGAPPENIIWSAELEYEVNRLINISNVAVQHEWISKEWSIADLDLAFMLNRLIKNKISVPDKLRQYVERNWMRESVQSWIAL